MHLIVRKLNTTAINKLICSQIYRLRWVSRISCGCVCVCARAPRMVRHPAFPHILIFCSIVRPIADILAKLCWPSVSRDGHISLVESNMVYPVLFPFESEIQSVPLQRHCDVYASKHIKANQFLSTLSTLISNDRIYTCFIWMPKMWRQLATGSCTAAWCVCRMGFPFSYLLPFYKSCVYRHDCTTAMEMAMDISALFSPHWTYLKSWSIKDDSNSESFNAFQAQWCTCTHTQHTRSRTRTCSDALIPSCN